MSNKVVQRHQTFGVGVVVILVLMSVPISGAMAQQYGTFISPGVSLGYLFGPNGGTVFSLEVSATYWPSEMFYYGAVTKLQLFC
jgi:hypothetical protein